MKKKLTIAGCVAAAVILIFLLLLCTVRPRVMGIWRHDSVEFTSDIAFRNDGTYARIGLNKQTNQTFQEYGTWKLSGFKFKCYENGKTNEKGAHVPYVYNPITNTLNNGGGFFSSPDDLIYKKVS